MRIKNLVRREICVYARVCVCVGKISKITEISWEMGNGKYKNNELVARGCCCCCCPVQDTLGFVYTRQTAQVCVECGVCGVCAVCVTCV